MEKDNGLSYWSILFNAGSFAELLDQMRMISQIHQGDQACLDALEAASREVAEASQALTQERESAEATRQELTATQAELQEKQQKSMETLEELLALGDEYREAIEAAESDMDFILAEIDDKQTQLDWEKYQQWLSTSVPETTPPTEAPTESSESTQEPQPSQPDNGGSEGWVVPVDYVYISSPFGTRVHPITGVVTTHYGVDLAAYLGNPIYATRSGVVTQATYGASGGYYVYIDHGDGFTSIYLHMTHYIVSAGDYVEAGQVIGYCGSTGASTGPHLHFGLIYNGAYVDPTKYVNLH